LLRLSRWRPRPQWSRWSAAGAPHTVVVKVALGIVVIATAAATVGPDEVEQRLHFGLGAVRKPPLVYAFVTADIYAAALHMVVRHRRQHDVVAGAERDGHILELLAPLRPIEPAVVYPTPHRYPPPPRRKEPKRDRNNAGNSGPDASPPPTTVQMAALALPRRSKKREQATITHAYVSICHSATRL
jgi:hypothetical protein